jgi:hypothetical protein
VYVDRQSINVSRASLLEGLEPKPSEESTYYHVRNFLDCVKSRKAPAAAMDIALNGELLTHLAWIAVESGEPLTWDSTGRKFKDSDLANRLLHRAMSSPWHS